MNEEQLEAMRKTMDAAMSRIAYSITESAVPGRDAAGVSVGSLTEAVMGMTAALMQIAYAINAHAEAVRSLDPGMGTLEDVAGALHVLAAAVENRSGDGE
jgi:hypothetical protein